MNKPIFNENERGVHEYLTLLKKMGEKNATLRIKNRLHYTSSGDFLLQHGRFFKPQALPERYERGPLGVCFRNAALTAVRHGLRYAEGYAMASMGIPFHHGWCVEGMDEVVEVTWDEPGLAYFGTVFNPMRVMKGSVLDNYQNNFKIYKKPFNSDKELL